MKIQPFNNIVYVELIEGVDQEKTSTSGIILPEKHIGRFIKVKILAVSDSKEIPKGMTVGSICLANALFESIDSSPNLGFINSKDILAKI